MGQRPGSALPWRPRSGSAAVRALADAEVLRVRAAGRHVAAAPAGHGVDVEVVLRDPGVVGDLGLRRSIPPWPRRARPPRAPRPDPPSSVASARRAPTRAKAAARPDSVLGDVDPGRLASGRDRRRVRLEVRHVRPAFSGLAALAARPRSAGRSPARRRGCGARRRSPSRPCRETTERADDPNGAVGPAQHQRLAARQGAVGLDRGALVGVLRRGAAGDGRGQDHERRGDWRARIGS